MSGCSIAAEFALAAMLSAQAPGSDPVAAVREHFGLGRYREALESAQAIEDPALRAQWRFHVRYVAGDLPGALREARGGMAVRPGDLILALNAAQCALELGEAAASAELVRRIAELTAGGAGSEHLPRIADLREKTEALSRAAQAAETARGRAKTTAVAVLGSAGAAIALLALLASARAK